MVIKSSLPANSELTASANEHPRISMVKYGMNVYSQINISDAAAALVVNDDNEILLIHLVRPVIGEIGWEIPRGSIQQNELPSECAARELYEKSGFTINHNHLLSLGFMTADNGIVNAKIHLFLHKTSQLRSSGNPISNPDYIKEIKWVNKTRVIEAIRTNQITDAATVATFGKARLLGII